MGVVAAAEVGGSVVEAKAVQWRCVVGGGSYGGGNGS